MPENPYQSPKSEAIAREASVLWSGYNVGYFSTQDIERWAERQIEASDDPSLAIIELATLRDVHPLDVLKQIEALASPIADVESIEMQIAFIGLTHVAGQMSLQSAVQGLYALLDKLGLRPDQRARIYHLDYGYDLAVSGYSAIEDVAVNLRDFVMPYTERLRSRNAELLKLLRTADA